MALYGYTKNTPGSAATSVTWSRSCDVGNTVVLVVQHQGSNTVTVTDSASNTWSLAANAYAYSTPAVAQELVDIWVCVPTVAVTSITATSVGSTATYWVLQAKDYAGALTVRSAAEYAGTVSGSPINISAASGDILITSAAYYSGTAGTQGDSLSGWTADGFNYFSTTASSMWEKTATTTATQGPTYSLAHAAGLVDVALYSAATNPPPTITAGATVTMTAGTTGTVVFTASDDVSVASFQTPTVSSTQDVAPTVGPPTLVGIGTATATATYPVTGLAPGDTSISTYAVDNVGAVSTSPATARIIYTSLTPTVRTSTLTGLTMTSPTSGTTTAALDAWLATPGTVAPPVFVTANPPATGANVSVGWQPLDATGNPYFGLWWAITNDGTTIVPTTVYVDLVEGTTVRATASAVISSYTPIFVGRSCTSAETATIVDRTALFTAGRFA